MYSFIEEFQLTFPSQGQPVSEHGTKERRQSVWAERGECRKGLLRPMESKATGPKRLVLHTANNSIITLMRVSKNLTPVYLNEPKVKLFSLYRFAKRYRIY